MRMRMVLAATAVGLLAATTGTSAAWVRKCTEEWRNSWGEGVPTIPATREYAECLV